MDGYPRVQRFLRSTTEYDEFHNLDVLVEAPFVRVDAAGVGIEQLHLAVTASTLLMTRQHLPNNKSNPDVVCPPDEYDHEIEGFEMAKALPLQDIDIAVTRPYNIRIDGYGKSPLFFEMCNHRFSLTKRQKMWEDWLMVISELRSRSDKMRDPRERSARSPPSERRSGRRIKDGAKSLSSLRGERRGSERIRDGAKSLSSVRGERSGGERVRDGVKSLSSLSESSSHQLVRSYSRLSRPSNTSRRGSSTEPPLTNVGDRKTLKSKTSSAYSLAAPESDQYRKGGRFPESRLSFASGPSEVSAAVSILRMKEASSASVGGRGRSQAIDTLQSSSRLTATRASGINVTRAGEVGNTLTSVWDLYQDPDLPINLLNRMKPQVKRLYRTSGIKFDGPPNPGTEPRRTAGDADGVAAESEADHTLLEAAPSTSNRSRARQARQRTERRRRQRLLAVGKTRGRRLVRRRARKPLRAAVSLTSYRAEGGRESCIIERESGPPKITGSLMPSEGAESSPRSAGYRFDLLDLYNEQLLPELGEPSRDTSRRLVDLSTIAEAEETLNEGSAVQTTPKAVRDWLQRLTLPEEDSGEEAPRRTSPAAAVLQFPRWPHDGSAAALAFGMSRSPLRRVVSEISPVLFEQIQPFNARPASEQNMSLTQGYNLAQGLQTMDWLSAGQKALLEQLQILRGLEDDLDFITFSCEAKTEPSKEPEDDIDQLVTELLSKKGRVPKPPGRLLLAIQKARKASTPVLTEITQRAVSLLQARHGVDRVSTFKWNDEVSQLEMLQTKLAPCHQVTSESCNNLAAEHAQNATVTNKKSVRNAKSESAGVKATSRILDPQSESCPTFPDRSNRGQRVIFAPPARSPPAAPRGQLTNANCDGKRLGAKAAQKNRNNHSKTFEKGLISGNGSHRSFARSSGIVPVKGSCSVQQLESLLSQDSAHTSFEEDSAAVNATGPRIAESSLHRLCPPCKPLASFEPQDVAQELTLIDRGFFIRIYPSDIHAASSANGTNVLKSSHLGALVRFSERLGGLLSSEILRQCSRPQRVDFIRYLIRVGMSCLSLRSYNALYCIVNALQSHAISRLKLTWADLRSAYSKEYKLYERLEDIADARNNWRCYRKHMRAASKSDKVPYLPILCIAVQDIVARHKLEGMQQLAESPEPKEASVGIKPVYRKPADIRAARNQSKSQITSPGASVVPTLSSSKFRDSSEHMLLVQQLATVIYDYQSQPTIRDYLLRAPYCCGIQNMIASLRAEPVCEQPKR